jgi:hypothetical protein
MCSKGPLIFAVVVVILFGVSLTPALAQGEAVLRGQLVAEADSSCLVQGLVTLKSTATGTSTETTVDANGRFAFSNVSPGE